MLDVERIFPRFYSRYYLVEETICTKTQEEAAAIVKPVEQVCMFSYSPRALDKREYLVIIRDNFCQFCTKTYVVTTHLNRLDETVQMRGHNI